MSYVRSTSLAIATLALLSGCDASNVTAPTPATTSVASDASLEACSACVVGPMILTRHAGAPSTHSWSVPATPGARFRLHLDDAGMQGANAQVMLNGIEIPWKFDESGVRRHHAVIELTLSAENALTVRLTGKPGSQLRVALEPVETAATATLTVVIGAANAPTTSGARNGPANGRVTAPGIDCVLTNDVATGDCNEAYPLGTVVTLVETPGARSVLWERFFLWSDGIHASGCPTPPGEPCTVTITGDTTFVAHFAPEPTVLVVTLVGPPGTSAWINGNEISCYLRDGVMDGPCGYRYFGGVLEFTLRVFPMDAVFTGWSGACSGTELECPLTSQSGDTVRVTATFAPL
ncbi:MAG: hypothetical protein ACJ8B6_11275 [Gemmatimonadales bacterium]